ncbi:MAG: winged helix-turn-helix transcriptional regulator [Myxococcales bacterium]|nr:winged helix-turn-helix transcriptional regulator [Myxococcales bacterium]
MLETLAALAEPNRLRIVELLRAGPQPVGEIGERLRLRQPQVSKHLQTLKKAGLVQMEPVAQQRVYELRPAPFRALHAWLERYRELWDARFDELEGVIEELKLRDQVKERSNQPKEKKNARRNK